MYDNGKGISETHLSHIFDRFYQVEKTQNFMGTGLGLSLSKEFIELHQGKIDAQSTIGDGTTFTIHLPLGEAHLSEVEKIEIPVNQPQKHEEPISDEIHYNPAITEEGGKIEFDISEIAYEVGFSSPTYFSKCFKDHFGVLPSEYKKKQTN